jgi:hypothetical protein
MTRSYLSGVAAIFVLYTGADAQAQRSTAPSAIAVTSLPPGTFRGSLVMKDDARDTVARTLPAVTGTAQWRIELDSLDWRRKITIRITLPGPEHAVYVIRTADSTAPQRVLHVTNLSPHANPTYFTAVMIPSGTADQRPYGNWVITDSVTFVPGPERASGDRTLRGTVRLEGSRDFALQKKPGERYRQQAQRTLDGVFAATFDPRPEPVPRTMTPALQRAIMDQALYDFGINWMNQLMHLGQGDSTLDNRLARGYLASRWGNAATVDSIDVSYRHAYVRLRGRYVPITCALDGDRAAGAVCSDPQPRRWWRRMLQL